MKKLILYIIAILSAVSVYGQQAERIFVSTDRSVYIAGDQIWCSLFCIDKDSGKLSGYSAVSYLELVSSDGTAAVAKVGLLSGRGAGSFRIPSSTPTGNYRLMAYTAANTNESGNAYLAGSKIVSIFNTTSSARVREGVRIVSDDEYEAMRKPREKADGPLDISMSTRVRKGSLFPLYIRNTGASEALFSLSVYNVDDIEEPAGQDFAGFLRRIRSEGPVKTSGNRLPEYDGEIVYAAVEGLEGKDAEDASSSAVAILSSAGAPSNVYMGKVESDGKIVFYTNNIYGDRELVCEVFDRQGAEGYIGITDPFIHPSPGEVPELVMAKSLGGSLVARKSSYAESFPSDTLAEFLPVREDLLLSGIPKKTYHLDDYVRFHSVREVVVEIIPELRVSKAHGGSVLQMIVQDPTLYRKNVLDNILIMIDGVAITDIDMLLGLDALLIKDVDIYKESMVMGKIVYNGMVNFITTNNYVSALKFSDNVRVVDFKGVSFPVAYTSDDSPRRRLLWWHPSMDIPARGEEKLQIAAPSYPGLFKLVAEGISEQGETLREVLYFEVFE